MSESSGHRNGALQQVLGRRRAGLLLHPTSLPGSSRHGELGSEAFGFVDFLAECGFSVWQILPLGPTHAGGSPYQCLSVFAGNPDLISRTRLQEWGWLAPDGNHEAAPANGEPARWLEAARGGFIGRGTDEERGAYDAFVDRHAFWLEDYAVFCALKCVTGGGPWWQWPPDLRDRWPGELDTERRRLADLIEGFRFEQFVFFRQWEQLKAYANERGILICGDMPIFVADDSADVWAHREYFTLDAEGLPEVVAGVPPDYFSATGQRWGNPHYHWDNLAAAGYDWWVDRVRVQLLTSDLLRVDHFRGFEAFWEIPRLEPTAINGRWVKAPGAALLARLGQELGSLPLIAEDLGIITPQVEALRDDFGLPGMKILQFAFGSGPENVYLPHHHVTNCVVYTGTHDNDTTLGWYQGLEPWLQGEIHEYFGRPEDEIPWLLIRAAMASPAVLAVIPMQDLLGLDGTHRMNTPGTSGGNWDWRFSWDQLPPGVHDRIRRMTGLYGRALS